MLTVLVTGSTDGIGLQSAKVLAQMGHTVLIHGREARKGAAAVEAVRAAAATGTASNGGAAGVAGAGSAGVRFMQADFASLREVQDPAAEVVASVPRLDASQSAAGFR
jgi:NAD(P)-dependent dehydrogenase (short-subunit alcohol dehydrogenase family)